MIDPFGLLIAFCRLPPPPLLSLFHFVLESERVLDSVH
mgnify:CR=1 FL=1